MNYVRQGVGRTTLRIFFVLNLCSRLSFPLGYLRETERLQHDGWWTVLRQGIGRTTLRIFFVLNLCLSFSFPLGYPRETERLHHDGWWTILGRGLGERPWEYFSYLIFFHVCLFHWVISVRLKDCTIMADELCKAGGWENDLENIFRT